MRKLLAGSSVALLLFAGAGAVAQPALLPDEAMVGFGVVDITPPIGVPLAGYGGGGRRAIPFDWSSAHPYAFFFRPSVGVHDPIEARAMVLERGDVPLIFLRLDLVAIDTAMVAAIIDRLADLGIPADHIIVSATHTHSGPGAWVDSAIFSVIATDRFRPDVFDHLVAGAEHAVRLAIAGLEPARLFATAFKVEGLQVNRRDSQAPVDHTANLLLARSRAGNWLGGIVNFAIHPTAFPKENLVYSADIPRVIEQDLGARLRARNPSANVAATLLFINGALGDVAPSARSIEGMQRLGKAFADTAAAAVASARLLRPEWTISNATVELGKPHLALSACTRSAWPRGLLGDVPLPLDGLMPGSAVLRLVRLGDMAMMTWPGEPTSVLGLALEHDAGEAGAEQAWVLGLTGDYKAYFTSSAEFAKNSYESCASLFGPTAGESIVEAYRGLLRGSEIK